MLQDQAEPRPYADVEHAILRELGMPIGALFAEFEPEARAAASLAQARPSSACNPAIHLSASSLWKGDGNACVLKPGAFPKICMAVACRPNVAPCKWDTIEAPCVRYVFYPVS